MSPVWFKRRRHGYGWTPVSPQGWGVTVGAVLVMLSAAGALAFAPQDQWWPLAAFAAIVAAAAGGLLWAAITHGPRPRWRWGRSPDDDPDQDY